MCFGFVKSVLGVRVDLIMQMEKKIICKFS